jgi:hypothetical protein
MAIERRVLEAINSRLSSENRRLAVEVAQQRDRADKLQAIVDRILPECQQQAEEIAALRRENAELKDQIAKFHATVKEAMNRVEELERAGHRQAAPFRRKKKAAEKKKPGRKPGFRGTRRARPPQIDQEVESPLDDCPHCHCPFLENRRPLTQYIEEIPPIRPVVTRLTTWQATCPCCGEVRSTHPLQVSLAQGAAAVHLGPRATALATLLKSHFGLPISKACAILKQGFGLSLTRGGLSQLLHRVAAKALPEHAELLRQIRASDAVYADETSWYVGQPDYWLWVFTTPQYTLYHVDESRGRPVAEQIIGANFPGVLVTDCASMYAHMPCKQHKCIAHHLRRLEEQRSRSDTKDTTYLDAWEAFWHDVLERTKERGTLPAEEFAVQRGVLEARMKALIARDVQQIGDRKFRTRMINAEKHLLGCLYYDVEATNNRAERAIRPAVIARKVSCGNKTPRGARTWEVLASRCATLYQQGADLLGQFALLVTLTPAPAG